MSDKKKLDEAIAILASNSQHWFEIKKILLDDIKSNQELITLIDQKIIENERKILHLN